MDFLWEVLVDAVRSLATVGPQLWTVVALTLVVSVMSTLIGVVLGVPLGATLALGRFRGKGLLRLAVSVGMGFPPVLAGLLLLLVFWRSGPLGGLGLIFTPTAMVIAQVVLATPIAAGVTAGSIRGLGAAAREQLAALPLGRVGRAVVAVREARAGVAAAVAACFGRVVAEVGAVLVVGGNIVGETRVLTTLIVEESRQARFGAAVAAGLILLAISMVVNVAVDRLGGRGA
ncbi:MAG: ABC transporter permease [bacterium]|nr:ABC transporter permease [Acidimicrobiia bacterium]MCY4648820.1 ABC transporter permease [bacterium]